MLPPSSADANCTTIRVDRHRQAIVVRALKAQLNFLAAKVDHPECRSQVVQSGPLVTGLRREMAMIDVTPDGDEPRDV
jgi:hypothetical protein